MRDTATCRCFRHILPLRRLKPGIPTATSCPTAPAIPLRWATRWTSDRKSQGLTGSHCLAFAWAVRLLVFAAGLPTYSFTTGTAVSTTPSKTCARAAAKLPARTTVLSERLYDSPSLVEATHVNLNDQTVEGIRLKNYPAFSVQYHPEASPGPHDARYLFDEFASMMQ